MDEVLKEYKAHLKLNKENIIFLPEIKFLEHRVIQKRILLDENKIIK
ncbi:38732_t:CDS:2, partial [Gigaspora margarita]